MATSREMTEGRLFRSYLISLCLYCWVICCNRPIRWWMLQLSVNFGDKCTGFCRREYIGHIPDTRFLQRMLRRIRIPVAQKFQSEDYITMRRYVAVSLQLAAVMSVVLAVVTSIYLCRYFAHDAYAGQYLHRSLLLFVCNFIGVPCTFFYNLLSSIIRALGDSKTPFWFLLFPLS